ncbi:Peptidase family M50, partial [Thermoplasmatales archaeon SCGC AB-539-C06]
WSSLNHLLAPYLVLLCFVNVFLGVFNLIPFGPLDGKKILRWNAIAWAFLLIIGAIIFSLIWPRMPAIIT